MGARILDRARGCGSLDTVLIGDALGWVIVEGIDLDDRHALDAAHRVEGERFYDEKLARARFAEKTDPAPAFGADP